MSGEFCDGWTLHDARSPLAKLIDDALAAKDWTKAELLRRVGYRNIGKGVNRLDAAVRTGLCPPSLVEGLARALELPRGMIELALQATFADGARQAEECAARRREEAKVAFRPYIFVRTERARPEPIHLAVLFHDAWKLLSLPSGISDWTMPVQVRFVGDLVRRHFAGKKGALPLFGQITGYEYRYAFDRALGFASDGRVIGIDLPPAETGGALRVSGSPFLVANRGLTPVSGTGRR